MNNEQDKDLSQLWQGIETQAEPEHSAQALAAMAKREQLKSKLVLYWDLFLCINLGVLLFFSLKHGYSYAVVGWLGIAIIASLWLTLKFNRLRKASHQALSDDTASFNQYLIDKAKADIRIGKLFNISNALVTASMVGVFGYENWYSGQPIIKDPSEWYFVIGWAVFWIGLLFYYGWWKIKKGKKALLQLTQHFADK